MSLFSQLLNLNELQVNGETVGDDDDFNIGEENADADVGTEAPADAAQNAAEQNEGNPDNETEDDFTLEDDEDPAEEEEQPENDNQTEEDNTDNAAEDGDDDFTIDDETAGEEGAETAEGGAEAQEGNETEEENSNNPTDGVSDEDSRAAEEAIYDSLTDDQKRIRVLQLKIDYKDLYETMINAIEGINGIPANMDNIDSIKRLIILLTKSKSILIDYINNNFDKNTYLENYTNYIKYLAVFRTASKVIEELNKAKETK